MVAELINLTPNIAVQLGSLCDLVSQMEPNLTNEKENILATICSHLLFGLLSTNPMQEYTAQTLRVELHNQFRRGFGASK